MRKVSSNIVIAIRATFEKLDAKPHHPQAEIDAIAFCRAFITEASKYSSTNRLAEQARQLLAEFQGYSLDNDSECEDLDEETLMYMDYYA